MKIKNLRPDIKKIAIELAIEYQKERHYNYGIEEIENLRLYDAFNFRNNKYAKKISEFIWWDLERNDYSSYDELFKKALLKLYL